MTYEVKQIKSYYNTKLNLYDTSHYYDSSN